MIYKHDVSLEQLRLCAPITPILEQAEGGLPGVIEAMRFSADDNILKFLKIYDATGDNDRHHIPWEVWAIKAKVNIQALLGAILIAMRQQSVNLIKVLAITNHPDTVRARIENAKTPRGYRDRDAIDTALGFLPQQKGATFIGKFFAAGAAVEEEGPQRQPDPGTNVDDLFPDISETQLLLTE